MKSTLKYTLVLCLLFSFFTTCEEEFEPEIDRYEDLLVVSGLITNEEGPYSISVSKSYSYDESKPIMLSDVTVKVIDDLGNEYLFAEKDKGTYTSDISFRAVVGRSYKLQLFYDNQEYESSFEKLNDVQGIDTVYWERTKGRDINDKYFDKISLYVDSKNEQVNSEYLQWMYEETWEFAVPFSFVDGYADKEICWATLISEDFNVGTLMRLNEKKIKKELIKEFTNDDSKLARRYSIELKQLSITKQVHDYYNLLNQQNGTSGSLFDKTPVSLKGNMSCISSPKEPVLGMFQVSGVKTKRIFIDRADLPKDFVQSGGMSDCKMIYVDVEDVVGARTAENDGMINVGVVKRKGILYIIYINTLTCCDCTRTGYPNKPPVFWIAK